MKKIIGSLLLLVVNWCYSQELNLPVFTQYLADNNFVISPAFAGIGDNVRIRVNGLTQWVGIKDAPDNQSLYADFRIADRSGIGISLYNDKNGYTKQSGLKVSFAHHLILDYYSKQYLSFGMSYNLNNFKIDIDQFNTTYDRPFPDTYITDNRAISNHNLDAGFLYRNKGYYISLNANNILNKIDNKSIIQGPKLLRNYQLYSGYVLKLPNDARAELEPSTYIQYFESDGRSSTDLNIKYRKYDRNDDYYWAGLSYRFLNDQVLNPLNIGPMAGFKKAGFYFAYSYQVTVNKIAAYNSGTHMITIGLDFLQGVSDCPCTQSSVND